MVKKKKKSHVMVVYGGILGSYLKEWGCSIGTDVERNKQGAGPCGYNVPIYSFFCVCRKQSVRIYSKISTVVTLENRI